MLPLKSFIVCEDEVLIQESSSKGNQVKFCKEGYWIKQDTLGYESLAECVTSDILELLNWDHVTYGPCKVVYADTGRIVRGCYSEDALKGATEITLGRAIEKIGHTSVSELWSDCTTIGEKCVKLSEVLEPFITSSELNLYLARLVLIDALTMNEDRHTHNIAFTLADERLIPMPIFDNGAAFCSDIVTPSGYPMDMRVSECLALVASKPFSRSFDEQAAYFLSLGNCDFWPPESILSIPTQYAQYYDGSIIERVTNILRIRRNYFCARARASNFFT